MAESYKCIVCGSTDEPKVVTVDGGSWGKKIQVNECTNCKARTHLQENIDKYEQS